MKFKLKYKENVRRIIVFFNGRINRPWRSWKSSAGKFRIAIYIGKVARTNERANERTRSIDNLFSDSWQAARISSNRTAFVKANNTAPWLSHECFSVFQSVSVSDFVKLFQTRSANRWFIRLQSSFVVLFNIVKTTCQSTRLAFSINILGKWLIPFCWGYYAFLFINRKNISPLQPLIREMLESRSICICTYLHRSDRLLGIILDFVSDETFSFRIK